MGHVYRTVDISLRRFVAVKVLKSGTGWTNQSSADHEVELLLQEAKPFMALARNNAISRVASAITGVKLSHQLVDQIRVRVSHIGGFSDLATNIANGLPSDL